jgi:hypothetical protein
MVTRSGGRVLHGSSDKIHTAGRWSRGSCHPYSVLSQSAVCTDRKKRRKEQYKKMKEWTNRKESRLKGKGIN